MPAPVHHHDQRAGHEGDGMTGSHADDKLARRARHYGLHLDRVAGEWRLSIPGGRAPYTSRRAFDIHRVISLHANALTRAHGRPGEVTAMQEAFRKARGPFPVSGANIGTAAIGIRVAEIEKSL